MLKPKDNNMLHCILQDKRLILASASPRRRDILALLGLSFDVVVSNIAEPITEDEPHIQAMRHALGKTAEIAETDALVIGADTIVVLNGRILGKPSDEVQARDYLSQLSGRDHEVLTGICVRYGDRYYTDFAQSRVWFSELTETEIIEYIATRESMDKAGAYGIQGYGSQFIHHIEGCYFNVMGFPVQTFYALIQQMQSESVL